MAVMDSGQADRYRKIGLVNDYAVYSGNYVLPVAEEPPTDPFLLAEWSPFDLVQAHAPYRLRVYAYNVDKEQNPPVLPAPASVGAYKFLEGVYSLPHPAVQTDNSLRWSANVLLTFAEQCASNMDTGFVIGNTVDATQSQFANAGLGNQIGENIEVPTNVRRGGIGPKAGWVQGQQINLLSLNWQYNEPSYYPATLFSQDLVSGPAAYNDLSITPPDFSVADIASGVIGGIANFFGQPNVSPVPRVSEGGGQSLPPAPTPV